MKGKLMSFEHSINFNRVQDFSIRRSSSAVIYTKLIKRDSLKRGGCVCFNESRFINFELQLKHIHRSKRPVPY